MSAPAPLAFRLALDGSTACGSVALAETSGHVRWTAEFRAGRGHSGELFATLDRAMQEIRDAGGGLTDVVVGLGPGSYSGVRQSIAAAIGIAAGSGAGLTGVSSPIALVPEPGNFQVIGDARRGAFYYTHVFLGDCVSGPELIADAAELLARIETNAHWPTLSADSDLPLPLHVAVVQPDAARLLAASPRAQKPSPLEPLYLRPVSITLPKVASSRAV